MGKPTNIASTSHAQAAELAVLAGELGATQDTAALKQALRDALARVEAQDAELTAEKEAHAATAAALEAATATKTE